MDKQITRLANSGAPEVLMFGRVWPLSPGTWGTRAPTRSRPSDAREVYKIDDKPYRDPKWTGGRCVRKVPLTLHGHNQFGEPVAEGIMV